MSSWLPPPASPQQRAIAHVAARSVGPPLASDLPVTLNFHPDRMVGGVPILQALAAHGVYRSQFETGTSNGGLTAYPGGDRWVWESRIFGGAYDGVPAEARPKYGALNYRRRATGAAPRFGSAHLRLRPEVLARCTFCYPDSVFAPEHFGVSARMSLIARAWEVSGGSDSDTDSDTDSDPGSDRLDDYIEAHVHGPIRLADDVEALVLDPCYRGTPIAAQAQRLPCALEWHPGFRAAVDTLAQYPGYRGSGYVDLARRIARDGWLDPACIGAAATAAKHAHEAEALKKVWHYLARYGDRAQP
ncbi:DUF3626 domain-containing protein [Cupriavidus sp. Marseille-Q8015]